MSKKGNKNAEKHGIFSKFIAVIDDENLIEGMSSEKNTAELAYARSRLANANKKYNEATSNDARIQWDYACRHWTEIIGNLIKANRDQRESEKAIFETLLDAVRAANDKQHVQR